MTPTGIERLRSAIGASPIEMVEFVLSSKSKGGRTKILALKIVQRRLHYGEWLRSEIRLLEGEQARNLKGGIGVIRLSRRDDDLVPEPRDAIEAFLGTAGLVVDVRGNGGGLRGMLAAFGAYLAHEGPLVRNCAAYRLAPGFDRDHLGGSPLLYRVDNDRWSDAPRPGAVQKMKASRGSVSQKRAFWLPTLIWVKIQL